MNVEMIWKDIRYAWRSITKSPAFSLTIILSLALAIGVNTAVFSVLNEVLLKPLPYKDSERIVYLNENYNVVNFETHGQFLDELKQGPFLEEIAGFKWMAFDINDVNAPHRVRGMRVTSRFLSVLGVRPVLGRAFSKEDDRVGAPIVVMVTYKYWQKQLSGQADAIGKRIRIDGKPAEIIGVLPKVYESYFFGEDIWIPMSALHEDVPKRGRSIWLIAKLKPGKTLKQTQDWINSVTKVLGASKDHKIELQTIRDGKCELEKEAIPSLLLWMGLAAFILMIACANVISLLLARIASRNKELTIRRSLGASRLNLVRLQLIESLLLSLLGGFIGFFLAVVAKDFFGDASHFPDIFGSSKITVSLNWTVVLFTALISVIAGIVSAIFPVFIFSRNDLNSSLKEGGHYSSSNLQRSKAGNIFVVVEISLAVILVVGAGLLVKGLLLAMTVDPGFQTRNVFTMDIPMLPYKHPNLDSKNAFYDELLERLRGIPGVEFASMALYLPSTGSANWSVQFEDSPTKWVPSNCQIVESDYFALMGIDLVQGRFFEKSDRMGSPRVVVVSENFARHFFPNQSSLGKTLKYDDDDGGEVYEIVGIVKDVHQSGLDQQKEPLVYFPSSQSLVYWMNIMVRSKIPFGTMSTLMHKQVWQMDPDQPIGPVQTMDQILSKSLTDRRLKTLLLSALGITGLLISIIGIYGLISYSVASRTKEIAIRSAIGAEKRDILKLITKQGTSLAIIGLAIGVPGALAFTRFIKGMIYGITPTDPQIFIAVCILFLLSAILASYFPALRASRIDPMVALKQE